MENNLGNLSPLTVETAAEMLRTRWQNDRPYTSAHDSSRIVVAVNPLKEIPGLRGRSSWSHFDKAKSTEETTDLQTHIYAVSSGAMKRIDSGRFNQAIIVSGESGAGKTETTKLLLEHLAKRNVDSNGSSVVRILAANPVLEAFGNASTVANENSSRFGKVLEVYFDEAHRLRSAECKTFLFERSRVTNRAENERNFHVFYQLLAGLNRESPRTKFALGLMELNLPGDFALLQTSSPMDPERDFLEAARTLRALSYLGISYIERMNLMKVLSAILHLGNLKFTENVNRQAIEIDMATRLNATHVSKLLGLGNSEYLEVSFCERTVNVRGESIKMSNTIAQANQCRDSFCRELYGRAFQWLVDYINTVEGASPEIRRLRSVSLLDIMGFEVQTRNSLEQLLINYANEKLQFMFSKQMVYQVQEEYLAEGLLDMATVPPHLLLTADDETVGFFENPSRGFFALLEQECFVPGGSDGGLVRKLGGFSKHVQTGKLLSSHSFVIKHFAGQVEYTAECILEKSLASVSKPVLSLLETSPLASWFESSSSHSRVGPARSTVGGKFKSELDSLLQRLGKSSDIAWIRCIRPNANKDPREFNVAMVKRQLHASGVVPAVMLARQGLPHHMRVQDFYTRFNCVLNRIPNLGQLRFGKTKVYLKETDLMVLNNALSEYQRHLFSIKIQAQFRAFVQRRAFMRQLETERRRKAELLQQALREKEEEERRIQAERQRRAQLEREEQERKEKEMLEQAAILAEKEENNMQMMKRKNQQTRQETIRIEGVLIGMSSFVEDAQQQSNPAGSTAITDVSSISSVTTLEEEDMDEKGSFIIREETSFILSRPREARLSTDSSSIISQLDEELCEMKRRYAALESLMKVTLQEKDIEIATVKRELEEKDRIARELATEAERLRQVVPPKMVKLQGADHIFQWRPILLPWKNSSATIEAQHLLTFVGPVRVLKELRLSGLGMLNLLPIQVLWTSRITFATKAERVSIMNDWVLDQLLDD